MNRTFIIFVLFGAYVSSAFAQQNKPTKLPASGRNPVRIEYYDTVKVPEASQEVLFNRSLDFVNKNYKHPKQVITSQYAPGGKLVGSFEFNAGKGIRVSYDITISSTDGGYMYSFFFISYTSDFVPNVMRTLSVTGSSQISRKDWIVVSKNISDTMTALVEKLKKTMAGQGN